MVTRPRLRSFFTALGLYVLAALLIGYFGVNAYTGDHGLRARQDLDQQIGDLHAPSSTRPRPSASNGSAASRCSSRTASIPTCSTSGRARCSTMPTRAILILIVKQRRP